MHSFHYRQGQLYAESVELSEVAERHGTPLYVYSAQTITDHYDRLHLALADLDHEICYALKANSNLAVLRLLAERGAGFDIVSGGELYRVLKAGGDPGRCTFAGVGKTRDEIEFALHCGILSFNIESEEELLCIDAVARSQGAKAPIAIRVNPDVAAHTHKYISTGESENKFGIALDRVQEVYATAEKLPNVEVRGIQMHIGSQILKSGPFTTATQKVGPLVQELRRDYNLEFFSIGGGLGIVYQDSLESGDEVWWRQEGKALTIKDYAEAIVPSLQQLGLRILLEPGRLLVGNAGVLLTRVLYVKRTKEKVFIIVDAGMNDLIRPALYQGYHEIVPVQSRADRPEIKADIVGPVCESGDFFAQNRVIAQPEPGELLALMSTGAYGFTMASNYNSRPLPAEVLVTSDQARLVRRRQNYADLIEPELLEEE
jgi:diaminopimelate decarboxylase